MSNSKQWVTSWFCLSLILLLCVQTEGNNEENLVTTDKVSLVDDGSSSDEVFLEPLSNSIEDEGVNNTSDDATSTTTERQNKLMSGDDSFAAALLMDIRDVLYREKSDAQADMSSEVLEERMDGLRERTESAIAGLEREVVQVRRDADRKVDLVLETFSTLKMLVQTQADHVSSIIQRLERVEANTQGFREDIQDIRRSVDDVASAVRVRKAQADIYSYFNMNDLSTLEPFLNTTRLEEDLAISTTSIEDLSLKVDEVTAVVDTMRQELQEVQLNMSDLEVSPIPVPELDMDYEVTTTSRPQAECGCDEINMALTRLEEGQAEQHLDVVQLADKVEDTRERMDLINSMTAAHNVRLTAMEEAVRRLDELPLRVTTMESSIDLLEGLTRSKQNLVASNTSTVVVHTGLCVWPYRRGGGACFYAVTEQRLSWDAARQHCRGLQGDLAAPANYDHFRQFMIEERLGRAYTYWLGGSDAEEEGVWRWVDGRAVDGSVWATREPSESKSSNCMSVRPAYRFVAADEECHTARYFICQQENS